MQKSKIGIGAVALLSLATIAFGKTFEEKAQVTLGGAEPVITGYISKIKDNSYLIKNTDGEETRVLITEATNMICKTRDEGRETLINRKPGRGFRIGDCPFTRGEAVKVEVSDEGEAILIRHLNRPPLPKTAELGLPRDFGVLPVPQGSLEFKETPPYEVRTLDGKTMGSLVGSVVDTDFGKAYMVVLRNKDHQYLPIPWSKAKTTFPSESERPIMVVLDSYDAITEMYPPMYEAKNRIDVEALRDYWSQKPAPAPVLKKGLDVDVIIKDEKFHVLTGGGEEDNIELLAGTEPMIQIRNEDAVAHEFVSPLFKEVGFSFEGKATLVTTPRATGVRLDPGDAVVLKMKIPETFEPLYGLFWCNIHGKEHGDEMRGELLIFESKGGRTIG